MLRSIASFSSMRLAVSSFESTRTSSTTVAAISQPSTRGERVKVFEIYRYNPEKPDVKPHLQVFLLFLNYDFKIFEVI